MGVEAQALRCCLKVNPKPPRNKTLEEHPTRLQLQNVKTCANCRLKSLRLKRIYFVVFHIS